MAGTNVQSLLILYRVRAESPSLSALPHALPHAEVARSPTRTLLVTPCGNVESLRMSPDFESPRIASSGVELALSVNWGDLGASERRDSSIGVD